MVMRVDVGILSDDDAQMSQRVNFREHQLDFFPLDLEKSFSISRSRLEVCD